MLLIATVLTALIFDFLNGFHDAANSIATVVSTRVLSPRLAVVWAASFNFLAAFLLGTAVAKTIGKGMIELSIVTQYVVLAGLMGAIVWDVLTWLLGTSHVVFPRADRRLCRRGHGSSCYGSRMAQRSRCHHRLRMDKDADLHRGRTPDGLGDGVRVHGGDLVDLPP